MRRSTLQYAFHFSCCFHCTDHKKWGMLDQLRRYLQLWKSSKNYKHDLDSILALANPTAPLHVRLIWLVDLMHWIRYVSLLHEYKEVENVRLPSARVKFLFMVLDRNPIWKKKVAHTLRSILKDVSAIDLFSEIGLSEEYGLWGELKTRFLMKLMPERPLSSGLSTLFSALFPDREDVVWVASLDPQLVQKVIDFISFEAEGDTEWSMRLNRDIEEALHVLAAQVRSMGLAPALRKRMDSGSIEELPFFTFTKDLDSLIKTYHLHNESDYANQLKNFRKMIWKCMDSFNEVYRHLDKYGVNTSVVFIIESAQAKLKRIDDLVTLLMFDSVDPEMLIYFLSQLIEENQDRKSLRSLLHQNTRLMARKIVDRSAETGSHYITQNKEEYHRMFLKACGGGSITAFTVLIKLMTVAIGLPLFIEGFFLSLNYTFSFIAIQLSGFTLATKQPAMTGPALASKLQHIDTGESVEVLVDEIVKLIRSQIAGVLGNILAVVPIIFLVNLVYYYCMGHTIVDNPQKADYIFHSTHLLGPTIIYASFTGILLWLSSIFAGYIDNWFFLHQMKDVITYNRRLNFVFGIETCKKIGLSLEKNISGFAGNISLGFLLGLVPHIMSFLGVFLDVRHVTLSSGTLALGVSYYGLQSFHMPEFWFAVAGIIMIGFLNLTVSFAMAFWVAIRSRNVKALQRRAIYSAIVLRMKKEPFSFFYPKKLKPRDQTDHNTSTSHGKNTTGQ